jgi:hypothetical protein
VKLESKNLSSTSGRGTRSKVRTVLRIETHVPR